MPAVEQKVFPQEWFDSSLTLPSARRRRFSLRTGPRSPQAAAEPASGDVKAAGGERSRTMVVDITMTGLLELGASWIWAGVLSKCSVCHKDILPVLPGRYYRCWNGRLAGLRVFTQHLPAQGPKMNADPT